MDHTIHSVLAEVEQQHLAGFHFIKWSTADTELKLYVYSEVYSESMHFLSGTLTVWITSTYIQHLQIRSGSQSQLLDCQLIEDQKSSKVYIQTFIYGHELWVKWVCVCVPTCVKICVCVCGGGVHLDKRLLSRQAAVDSLCHWGRTTSTHCCWSHWSFSLKDGSHNTRLTLWVSLSLSLFSVLSLSLVLAV